MIPSAKLPAATRLGPVLLAVRNRAAMADFYGRALGLRPQGEKDGALGLGLGRRGKRILAGADLSAPAKTHASAELASGQPFVAGSRLASHWRSSAVRPAGQGGLCQRPDGGQSRRK